MLTFCYNKQLESFCDFRETNRSITCEVACVKGVRRGRGRELGRETTREGGGTRGTRSRAPKFPLPLLTPAMQATLKGFLNNTISIAPLFEGLFVLGFEELFHNDLYRES